MSAGMRARVVSLLVKQASGDMLANLHTGVTKQSLLQPPKALQYSYQPTALYDPVEVSLWLKQRPAMRHVLAPSL